MANEGQTCCSPREVKVCSVFFRLLHFSSSRIYKSRMALHIVLGSNLPRVQFLLKLTCSWWLQCICQLAFLKNNEQKKKRLRTSLGNCLVFMENISTHLNCRSKWRPTLRCVVLHQMGTETPWMAQESKISFEEVSKLMLHQNTSETGRANGFGFLIVWQRSFSSECRCLLQYWLLQDSEDLVSFFLLLSSFN